MNRHDGAADTRLIRFVNVARLVASDPVGRSRHDDSTSYTPTELPEVLDRLQMQTFSSV